MRSGELRRDREPVALVLALEAGDRGVHRQHHRLVALLGRLVEVREAHLAVLHQVELEPVAASRRRRAPVGDRRRRVRRERVRQAGARCGGGDGALAGVVAEPGVAGRRQHDRRRRRAAQDRRWRCPARPPGRTPSAAARPGRTPRGCGPSRARRPSRRTRSPRRRRAPGGAPRARGRRRSGTGRGGARWGCVDRPGLEEGLEVTPSRDLARGLRALGGLLATCTITLELIIQVGQPRSTTMAADRIRTLTLSHVVLPLDNPVSDAKVLTGRQKPLTETVLLFVEVTTEQGHQGMGFSYSKRAGGPAQYTHLREVAEVAIGQDPSDIADLQVAAVGRRVGRPVRCRDPGDRRARRRAVGPQGASRRPAAGQAARRAPRLVPGLQHLGRLPPGLGRGDQGEGDGLAGVRHRRHQDQGRPARLGRGPAPGRRAARAPRRHPVHGRRQPAVGPRPRPPDVPRARGSSTWSGSRSRSTPGTPSATPTSPARSTPRSPPARC